MHPELLWAELSFWGVDKSFRAGSYYSAGGVTAVDGSEHQEAKLVIKLHRQA